MKENINSAVCEAQDTTKDASNFERRIRDRIARIKNIEAANFGSMQGMRKRFRRERNLEKVENKAKEKVRPESPLPPIDKRACLEYADAASRRAEALYILANSIHKETPQWIAKSCADWLHEAARKWEKAAEMWREIANRYFS